MGSTGHYSYCVCGKGLLLAGRLVLGRTVVWPDRDAYLPFIYGQKYDDFRLFPVAPRYRKKSIQGLRPYQHPPHFARLF